MPNSRDHRIAVQRAHVAREVASILAKMPIADHAGAALDVELRATSRRGSNYRRVAFTITNGVA